MLRWQPSGNYATGTVIQIDVSPSVSAFDITNGSTTNIGNGGFAQFTATSTEQVLLTVVTSTSAFTASTTLYLPFTLSASSTNYAFSFLTTSSTSSTVPTDFGASLLYANGGNQVTVSASVPSSLSFAIRNSADSADTNSCALGTLSTGAIATCSYRLRIATNAAGGFQSRIQANQDFANSQHTATFTNIGDNGTFTAGTEAYGIQVLTGATSGVRNGVTGQFSDAVTEDSSSAGFTFGTDASPVPTSTPLLFVTAGSPMVAATAPSLVTTSLVTHAAAINGGTPAGSYSQIVTYTVTASF